jgi:hypothetical protein
MVCGLPHLEGEEAAVPDVETVVDVGIAKRRITVPSGTSLG